MSTLGAVHTVFAFLALLFGAVVLRLPKGTRWHRTWGHAYVFSMAGLVVTALFVYRLTGTFGPFHLAALVAGATVLLGVGSVLLRRPRTGWMSAHATWMSWSYVGLVAAFVAETSSRWVLPRMEPFLRENQLGGAFWTVVAVASLLVGVVGWWLIQRYLPRALARTPEAVRRERRALRDLPDRGDGVG